MLRGVQHNVFSRTSLYKLLNKIDRSNVLKDGKIEAVHAAASVVLVGNLICRLHHSLAESLTSMKHQQMVTSYAFCIKTTDRSNRSLNDTMVFMKSITFGLSQEARKVEHSHFLTVYNN